MNERSENAQNNCDIHQDYSPPRRPLDERSEYTPRLLLKHSKACKGHCLSKRAKSAASVWQDCAPRVCPIMVCSPGIPVCLPRDMPMFKVGGVGLDGVWPTREAGSRSRTEGQLVLLRLCFSPTDRVRNRRRDARAGACVAKGSPNDGGKIHGPKKKRQERRQAQKGEKNEGKASSERYRWRRPTEPPPARLPLSGFAVLGGFRPMGAFDHGGAVLRSP